MAAFDVCIFGERLLPNTANQEDPVVPLRRYARTDADGNFSISYRPGTYDLTVRVYDGVLRPLGIHTVVRQNVSEPLLTLGPKELEVSRELATGYAAKAGEFILPVDGNEIVPLVDNHDAWSEITTAVEVAQHSIDWMLFYLDVRWVYTSFTPDVAEPIGAVTGRRLEEALKAAGRRGVVVRLACNQLIAGGVPVPWPFTTAISVELAMLNAPNVTVRPVLTHFSAPIHTKFVVIDNDLAYIIGSPFVSDYYDDVTHTLDDARRGTFIKPIDSRGIRVPVHDVSLRVRGPAIQQLTKTFLLHWTGQNTATPPTPPVHGTTRLQVTRSLCGNERWPEIPQGETSILESYLRAINNATDYIYLENQYFTEPLIADALVLRLKQAAGLQVILLTNNKVDLPDYSTWQPQTLLRMLKALTSDERRRLGLFTTWSHHAKPGTRSRIIRNYIHSKVGIIDDNWATVGSANLDGASLNWGQNGARGKVSVSMKLFPALRVPGDVHESRESETNLVVFDGIENGPETGFVAQLRRSLWAEHLGFTGADGRPDVSSAEIRTRPADGWLPLWHARAGAKLAALTKSPPDVHAARVLRFPFADDTPTWPSKADTASGYLEWAGASVDQFHVHETFRRFDWGKGEWIDAEPSTP